MRATAEIGTGVVYAAIQEFGGTIHAKRGGWLVFRLPSGQWIRTKSVTIPAHPYLRPAFDYNKATAIATIGKVFERLVMARHTL